MKGSKMKKIMYVTAFVLAGTVLVNTAEASANSSVAAKEILYLTHTGSGLDVVRLAPTGKDSWSFSFFSGAYTAKLKTLEPGHLYGMYKGSKKKMTPDMVVNMSVKDNGSNIVYTVKNMTAPDAPLESTGAVRVQANAAACADVANEKFCVGNKATVPAHDQQLIPRVYDIQQLYFNDAGQALAFKEVYGPTPISELSLAHVVDLSNPSVRCAKPGVCIGDAVSFRTNNLFSPIEKGTVLGFSPDGILLSNASETIVENVQAAMDPISFTKPVNTSCDELSKVQQDALWKTAAAEAHVQCLATGRADDCYERPLRDPVVSFMLIYVQPTADGKGCQAVGKSIGTVSSPVK